MPVKIKSSSIKIFSFLKTKTRKKLNCNLENDYKQLLLNLRQYFEYNLKLSPCYFLVSAVRWFIRIKLI